MAGSYRADRVHVTVKGQILHGYAPGTFVTAEMAQDQFSLEKGADGEGAWLQNLDDSGMITVNLMQASTSNADLETIAALGEIVQVQVADHNGTTLCRGTARIKRKPNAEFSNQFVPRAWEFLCEKLEIIHGGVTATS
jgi:hypothetical protein